MAMTAARPRCPPRRASPGGDGDGSTGGGAGSAAAAPTRKREGHRPTLRGTCAACAKSCRAPVIPHLEAEVLTDRVRHHPTWKTVQTRALKRRRRAQPRPPRRPILLFARLPVRRRDPSERIPAPCSLGGVVANTPSPSVAPGHAVHRLHAQSEQVARHELDNARFVPGEAPNKRGCTSSSAVADARNAHVRRRGSPLALVSRFGEPRESRPDNLGASTSRSFIRRRPWPSPTSTPESPDTLTFSTLPPITNVRGPRVRPRTPGARHGADDCGREEGSETKRSRGSARAKIAKKRHDVCRSSLINRETSLPSYTLKTSARPAIPRFNALMV